MTDVILTQTPDGGDITVTNAIVAMDDGISTAVYLSMFGGNWDDSGLKGDDSKQWWGNLIELDSKKVMRSQTQFLLSSIPAIPANLRRIEDAAKSDLAWMVSELSATVTVGASMPGLNQISISGVIEIDQEKTPFSFNKPWAPNLAPAV